MIHRSTRSRNPSRHLRVVRDEHTPLSVAEQAQVADAIGIIFASTERATRARGEFNEEELRFLIRLRDSPEQVTGADHDRLTYLALLFQRRGGC